jgi:hypothetical protein
MFALSGTAPVAMLRDGAFRRLLSMRLYLLPYTDTSNAAKAAMLTMSFTEPESGAI